MSKISGRCLTVGSTQQTLTVINTYPKDFSINKPEIFVCFQILFIFDCAGSSCCMDFSVAVIHRLLTVVTPIVVEQSCRGTDLSSCGRWAQ